MSTNGHHDSRIQRDVSSEYQARPMRKILLTPPEAAALLSISERTLFDLTDENEIRSVGIGRLVLYRPQDLRDFADRLPDRPRRRRKNAPAEVSPNTVEPPAVAVGRTTR
jgi:excisionase family DNA binding protein